MFVDLSCVVYGQMLFDGAEAGFDYLDVSRRALQRIDFKLQDSFRNVLDLRGNHWSFSLVCQCTSKNYGLLC
jgi:hypothetical protein